MSELRKDPIVGRWVVVAKERAKRPNEPRIAAAPRDAQDLCPFCEGNEAHTPPEVAAFRHPGSHSNGPGWRVRVVPNRFPALRVEENLEKQGDGIYDRIAGVGAHEVIIETPVHQSSMAAMRPEGIREVLWIYRDRLLDLKNDRRFVHGTLFKNVGAAAGSTLEHTHSQLVVSPVVPTAIQEELDGSRLFFDHRGRCVYCDMIRQELAAESRIVVDTSGFTAFCPYASRFPFETWIVPKHHSSRFDQIGKSGVDDLGHVLHEVLFKLERGLDGPAYNYYVHTSPFDQPDSPHYHWHLEVIPRLNAVGGFEWGSGFHLNPVPPESAAAFLREVDVPPASAVAGLPERTREPRRALVRV